MGNSHLVAAVEARFAEAYSKIIPLQVCRWPDPTTSSYNDDSVNDGTANWSYAC